MLRISPLLRHRVSQSARFVVVNEPLAFGGNGHFLSRYLGTSSSASAATLQDDEDKQLHSSKASEMQPFNEKFKRFFENTPAQRNPRSEHRTRRVAPLLSTASKERPWSVDRLTKSPTSATTSSPRRASPYRGSLNLQERLRKSQEQRRKSMERHPTTPPPTTGSSALLAKIMENVAKVNAATNRAVKRNEDSKQAWRLGNMKDLREQHQNNNSGQDRSQRRSKFLRKGRQQQRYNKPTSEQDIVVTIPAYDVSLAEASLLFREKTRRIRQILEQMGELGSSAGGQQAVLDDDIFLDPELMEIVAIELNRRFEKTERQAANRDEEILLQRRAASEAEEAPETASYESLPTRPPVVVVMGHVDHGKTTLMDSLRRKARGMKKTGSNKKKSKKDKKASKKDRSDNVAGTEAGGITQVITAFQVPLEGHENVGGNVTFLDTPGHAAFRAMRESGSDAADIVVLVVAADDGVSKQTVEIIDFYKSIVESSGNSGISLVVAMNKIDKPGIDVDEARMRIESQLLEQGILVEGMPSENAEEYGPPVQLFPVSALKGDGIDDLIEGLALQSEIMDLRADDEAGAEGIVLDARVEKGLGIVADCIIRWGSLEKGDIVVSGTHKGKVRLLKDVNEKQLKKGNPSQPVRIVGFDTVPKAGDPILVVQSEDEADEMMERRRALDEGENFRGDSSGSNAELQSSGKHLMNYEWKEALETKYNMQSEDSSAPIRIPVIVKADADGSLSALRDSIIQIGSESSQNVVIDPILSGVGPPLPSEVQLAKESGASIVCFNLKPDSSVAALVEESEVPLISSKVIYTLLDEAKVEFASHLPKVPVEIVHGRAKLKATFDIGGLDDKVAGLQVVDGTLYRDKVESENGTLRCEYRILRNGKVLPTSSLKASTLKHFKDDVEEVKRGNECGLALAGHNEYEDGDEIECFSIQMRSEFI